MSCLKFTNLNKQAFVFSLDAVICVLLLISAIFLVASMEKDSAISSPQTTVVIEDLLFFLENSGYLIETIDSNSPTQSAVLIRQKILENLPVGFDTNISVTTYEINQTQCASQQNFESCFPDGNKVVGSSGTTPQNTIFSGKKVFLRKQPPGDCNVDFISFSSPNEKIIDWVVSNIKSTADAFFAEEDINVTFDISVSPSGAVVCDEEIEVTLSVTIPEAVRRPIDLALVLDKSGSMSWSGRYATSAARNLYKDGGYIYLADGTSGIRSINVSTPLLPTQSDRYDPGTIYDVHGVNGSDYVFTSETRYTDELIVIDKSNPSDLREVESVNFDWVRGLFVSGNYVYVAGEAYRRSDSGLVIMNATNPLNLSETDRVNTSDPQGVFVSGDYVYLADGGSGLIVINVSNKSSAFITDTYNTTGSSRDVFVSGDYAYVADGYSGLIVLNISDPYDITLADSYNTPDYAEGITVLNNTAYVADGSSLQIIDVTTPNDISFIKEFETPYDYQDVVVDSSYAYVAAGSIGLVTLDLDKGPRLLAAKGASKLFVDYNAWSLPPDQMSIVSFSDSVTVNQELTSVKLDLNSAIDAIYSSGGTNIQIGIDSATVELIGANANPQAMKFQVVLSDGQSNYGDSLSAAQTAADNNITIFTIGFGADADETELTNIANAAGGSYHHADDANALQEVFDIIARKVSDMANDSNVSVPVFDGSAISDLGGGEIIDGNIVFDAGDITIDSPWVATYTLTFPCDNADVCIVDALTFPGPGTTFNYTDLDMNSHSVDFDASITLDFNTRDLKVEILTGDVTARENVELDVFVENIGELDANATTLRFYHNDITGELLKELNVSELCSTATPSCSNSSQLFSSVTLDREGVIYARINDSNTIKECPQYNIDAVNCYIGPETQIFVIDYSVGRGEN